MALYGNNFYNLFTYGADQIALVDFSASPIYAYPSDYNAIKVSWTKPAGDWSNLMLVRNPLGFPVTPDDGDILVNVTKSGHDSLSFPYLDNNIGGKYAYEITSWSRQNNVATIDIGLHSLAVGNTITVNRTTDGSDNIDGSSFVITAATYTTVSYANVGANAVDIVPNAVGDTYPSSVIQTGAYGLLDNQIYYYSVFVKRTSDGKWFRAGNTMAMSVKNYGTVDLMYQYLPPAYRVTDLNTALTPVSTSNPDLYNFLKVFAFEYDYIKAMAENIRDRYKVSKLSGKLLPVMMDQYGFTYETEMGLAQGRRLLHNSAKIYLTKGSTVGIKTFIKEFTGYDATIPAPKNLMLTLDDASFATSVGSWDSAVNCTLSRGTGTSESPTLLPYSEPTSPANYPNSQLGFLKLTASASGGTVFAFCGETAPKTLGIPVTAGAAYTFSVYAKSKVTARTMGLYIRWFDRDGAFISGTSAVTSTSSTSAWTRLNTVSGNAPSTAYFAVPVITIASTAANEIHYFDAAQFEAGSTATDYVDARRIDIYLQPERINHIYQPSFETSSVTGWTTRYSTTSVSSADSKFGTKSMLITVGSPPSTTTAGVNVSTTLSSGVPVYMPPVTVGETYTYSAYIKDIDSGKSFKSYAAFYDSSGTYLGAGYDLTGDLTAVTTTDWTRVSITFEVPAGAAYVRPYTYAQSVYTTDTGKQWYMDAIMLEKGSELNPYFDGSTGYYETTDLLWEGTNVDRSMYYKNRVNTFVRLNTIISDFLPYGSTYALFIGTIV